MDFQRGCLIGTLLIVGLSPLTSPAQSSCTQNHIFSGEEDSCFDAAPNPFPSVISAILKTREGKEAFDDLDAPQKQNVTKLFRGLTVHLRSKAQQDMIVRGDPPMSGGDNTWFWVVISVDDHPIAFWVQGNAVTILRTRHRGYADIRTDWAAGSHRASRVFRFDGSQYKLFKDEYEDLPSY